MPLVPTILDGHDVTARFVLHVGAAVCVVRIKIDGFAVRVPTPNVSIVDLTARLSRSVTMDELKEAYERAADTYLKGILDTEWRSLVSTDFNYNPHSAVVYLPFLRVVDDKLVKVLSWYDNEYAFAVRVAELVHEIHEKNNS